MHTQIVKVIASTCSRLNDWLATQQDSTIFHSCDWSGVLEETYGYHPLYFTLEKSGRYCGCLPVMEVLSRFTGKRGVCLSFSDYCGSIVQNEEDFKLLFDSVVSYGRSRKWRYIEFRGEAFLAKETPSKIYSHHVIELSPDDDFMLSRIRKSTVRNIHKAVKEGVTVEMSSTLDGIMQFYKLHCLTRKRQGLPPQPEKYFKKLHEKIICRNLGFTGLARQGDVMVAGLVCLHFGIHAIYKYGASDAELQHLRANNLLFWETMRTCSRQGFRYFSLGRTDLENNGLLNFKNGWGGKKSDLNYYRYDVAAARFSCVKEVSWGVKVLLKRMPVCVLRLLGELAYPHLG